MTIDFSDLKCAAVTTDEPSAEDLRDYEEWEKQQRDCYLNRLNGIHAAMDDPEGDGCLECGYGAK